MQVYAEQPNKIYDPRFFDEGEGMGWIGAVIGAGTGLLPLITGLISACKPGQACGLQGITSFGNQVMQTLDQIVQMLRSGMITPTDAIANAQKVSAALADPQFVYQAKNGKDAAALQDLKAKAAAKVQEIISLAATVKASPAAASQSSPATGIGPILMLAAGGLVLLLALKK